jgi:positive regulator of sigma E activity
VEQPDVKSQGILFSAVMIYLMNLLTMTVTATALSRVVTFGTLAHSLVANIVVSYGWTLDNLGALWNYVVHGR